MDRLRAIALFSRVVECGSFSEAGRQLNLAPSSVSRQIVDLEGWVGAALFHRTTRQLNLTEVGRKFYERGREILLDLEEARVVAARLEDQPAGLIRLSVPDSIERHMTAAMCDFQARWPSVRFAFNFTDRMVDLVAEGFDLAVRLGQLDDSTLKVRKLAEVRRYLCASPRYLKRYGIPAGPEEITEHNCLIFRTTPGYNVWSFSVGSETVDVRASGSFAANSGRALTLAACDGLGLMLAPEWLVGAALKSGELIEILPNHLPQPLCTPLYALHPYQRFVPPKVRAFIDFLADRFVEGYDWSRIFQPGEE